MSIHAACQTVSAENCSNFALVVGERGEGWQDDRGCERSTSRAPIDHDGARKAARRSSGSPLVHAGFTAEGHPHASHSHVPDAERNAYFMYGFTAFQARSPMIH